jgi:hypothetical protein
MTNKVVLGLGTQAVNVMMSVFPMRPLAIAATVLLAGLPSALD